MLSGGLSRRRILIADDSPTVTGILSYIFTEEGFSVETAADGVEAIRRFYQSPPDLVILDIEMPRMNGYQVCRILKDDSDASATPVIVLTSRDLQSDRFRGLAAGADAYLVKNLEDDQLLVTVKQLIADAQVRGVKPAKSKGISDGEVLQYVNTMLDRRLFISTVTSQVEAINSTVSDWDGARREVLQLFSRVFEFVAGGILLKGPKGCESTLSVLNDFPEEALFETFASRARREFAQAGIVSADGFASLQRLRHSPAGSKLFPVQEELNDWFFRPLLSGGVPFGIIGMAGSAPLKFDQEGKELFNEFVGRAEIVLDNARLIALTEAANQELADALTQLRQMQAQLVQSEKMASLGQLMAGLTHEMNNPLNFVAGNLDHLDANARDLFRLMDAWDQTGIEVPQVLALKEEIDYDFLRADLPGMLADLREGVIRAKGIIADLRTFSAQDGGQMLPTDMAAVIASTLNILRHEWEGSCEIVSEIEEIPPFECNSGQIGQVVMNLVSNAIKAVKETGKRGKVFISLKQTEDTLTLTVADEGVGIKPEAHQHLYQPFFTTREVGQGMGLGLSISYGIVKRHRGEILFESESGKGSKFTVRLPLANGELQPAKG